MLAVCNFGRLVAGRDLRCVTSSFLQSNPNDVLGDWRRPIKRASHWLTDKFGKGQPFKDARQNSIRDKKASTMTRLNLNEGRGHNLAYARQYYLAQIRPTRSTTWAPLFVSAPPWP